VNNAITAYLRTIVPALWGTALAWLVDVQVLDAGQALDAAPFGPLFLVPVTIGAYYALVRAAEVSGWLPGWLAALLLGAPVAPDYTTGEHAA
jgi:hypothetical protein